MKKPTLYIQFFQTTQYPDCEGEWISLLKYRVTNIEANHYIVSGQRIDKKQENKLYKIGEVII